MSPPGRRAFVIAGAVAALAGCGSPRGPYWPIVPPDLPPPRAVSESANGSTVDVVRTQWVNVVLPAEGQGPNRWTYVLGKDAVLYPSGDTPRYEALQGATSGNAIFTFRAEAKGTTSVTFVYRNRDDPQAAVVKSVSFDVVSR